MVSITAKPFWNSTQDLTLHSTTPSHAAESNPTKQYLIHLRHPPDLHHISYLLRPLLVPTPFGHCLLRFDFSAARGKCPIKCCNIGFMSKTVFWQVSCTGQHMVPERAWAASSRIVAPYSSQPYPQRSVQSGHGGTTSGCSAMTVCHLQQFRQCVGMKMGTVEQIPHGIEGRLPVLARMGSPESEQASIIFKHGK